MKQSNISFSGLLGEKMQNNITKGGPKKPKRLFLIQATTKPIVATPFISQEDFLEAPLEEVLAAANIKIRDVTGVFVELREFACDNCHTVFYMEKNLRTAACPLCQDTTRVRAQGILKSITIGTTNHK